MTCSLLVEVEYIRGGMCHTIYRYVKTNNKYMKKCNKKHDYYILTIANNLYEWAISQKLNVNGFKWVEDTSQFTKDFIENHIEGSDKGCLPEDDVQYL